jgi:hypothetical protein
VCVIRFIRNSNDVRKLDPEAKGQHIDDSARNTYEFALSSTMRELSENTTANADLLAAVRSAVEIEIVEEKRIEDAVQEELAVGKLSVQELKHILAAHGLPTAGTKKELMRRIRDNDVDINHDRDGVDSDEEEGVAQAVSAWSKFRKPQLVGKLERIGLETGGSKPTLARRIAKHYDFKLPDDLFIEYKFEEFGDISSRVKAMLKGRTCAVSSFQTALWALAMFARERFGGVVYGGFVRDTLIKGVYHLSEDLDIALPDDIPTEDVEAPMREWCANNHCEFRAFKKGHRSGVTKVN